MRPIPGLLCLLACSCLDAVPEADVSQEAHLKIRGLYTNPSPTDAPEGALSVADDVVIRRDSTLEPRRGVTNYGDAFAANRLFPYRSSLYGHGTLGATANTLARYIAGTWTSVGVYAPPDTTLNKMRTAEAGGNLYFTTSTGVYFLDAAAATPVIAGVPKPTSLDRDRRVATCAIGGLVRATNVVTATTSAAHGFYVGQVVNMNSAGEAGPPAFAAGNFTITAVPSTTTFKYAETGADGASGAQQTFLPASLVGTGGFLADGSQVAYRATINAPDANNVLKESSPSSRWVVPNASTEPGYSGAVVRNVVVRILLPSGVSTTDYVRLYRSKQVATTSEPSEEMGLVWEALIKTGDITAGYVDVTDIATDALRGATGYFCPSQEGEAQANEPPPLANDIALFHGSMFYASTTGPHRFEVSLLGVGGTDGIQNLDQLLIDNASYTATTSTPTTATKFKLETGGTAAQNIRDTAMNLVAVVNRDTTNTSRAFYVSGQNDLPGKIVFERKALGGSAWSMYSTGKRTCWAPVANPLAFGVNLSRTGTVVTATAIVGSFNHFLGESVTLAVGNADFPAGAKTLTSVTASTVTWTEAGAATTLNTQTLNPTVSIESSNDAGSHRLYWSKPGQPEAVPLLNYEDIGSAVYPIKRIVALRDALFVFKQDGIFKVTGDNGYFSSTLFDPTVQLIAPDTAVATGNRIFGLTSAGVVAVSETGVELVSRPIEYTLRELQAKNATYLEQTSFGVGYESDSTYELRVPDTTATSPNQAYIYNTLTDSWVRDTITAKHGLINPADEKRYLAGTTYVLAERKGLVYTDYSDVDVAVTISSVTNTPSLTMASTSGVDAGDILEQSGTKFARITSITDGTHMVVDYDPGFTAAAATVHKAIPSAAGWFPYYGGAPAKQKLWRGVTFQMGDAFLPAATVLTRTELTGLQSQTVNGITTIGQWTAANVVWDGTESPFNLQLAIPQESRRSARLSVAIVVGSAWAHWTVEGLTLTYNGGSERVAR